MKRSADPRARTRTPTGCALQIAIIMLLGWLLGAVSAVGVSWQIARQAPAFDIARSPPRWSHATGAAWLYQKEESFGAIRLRGQFALAESAGNRRAVPAEMPPSWSSLRERDAQNTSTNQTIWEEAFGWPRPSMVLRIRLSPRTGALVGDGIDIGPHPTEWSRRLYLPTEPIWSGIAFDALIFAPAWWIVLCIFGLIGRWILHGPQRRRARRGLCPECGYDLRGKLDDGCSECGWKRGAT